MVVFIIDKKNFNASKLKKEIDLIYTFDDELYQKLSKKYKVVLIDKRMVIEKENFFNKDIFEVEKSVLIRYKLNFYNYFEKEYRKFYRKKVGPIRRTNIESNIVYSFANKKKSNNEIVKFLDEEIFLMILRVLEYKFSKEFVEKNKKFLRFIFNYISSCYRAYCYSFGYKRGSEILLDIFRFSSFYEICKYYLLSRFDVYRGSLKKDYTKVLSRLFIEDIHKTSIEKFLSKNITQWVEYGWFKEKK